MVETLMVVCAGAEAAQLRACTIYQGYHGQGGQVRRQTWSPYR